MRSEMIVEKGELQREVCVKEMKNTTLEGDYHSHGAKYLLDTTRRRLSNYPVIFRHAIWDATSSSASRLI